MVELDEQDLVEVEGGIGAAVIQVLGFVYCAGEVAYYIGRSCR